MLALLALCAPMLCAPLHAASADQVRAALDTFNQHATIPLPVLDDSDLNRLERGGVVRMVDREQADVGPARAIGMTVLATSRDATWLALQDPHFAGGDGLIEALVAQEGPDRMRWFGYLDVPRPFKDRQWVIDVWNEHGVAEATGGLAWEHPWTLTPDGISQVEPMAAAGQVPGLTAEMLAEAVTTPMSRGAWVAIELGPQETLLVYHCRFDVGGRIPDGLFTQYITSTLPKVLRKVEERAVEEVPTHYVTGHEPVIGGDGQPLPALGP